jgi:hypothetical protein
MSSDARLHVAWLLWCIDQGYVNAADRAILQNWLKDDPATLHPDDAARRPHLLAMADEVLEAAAPLTTAPWLAHIQADHEVLRAVWTLASEMSRGIDGTMVGDGEEILRTMAEAGSLPWPGPGLEGEIRQAAADEQLSEALAALAKVAKAAGVYAATLEAQSITEVSDIIIGVLDPTKVYSNDRIAQAFRAAITLTVQEDMARDLPTFESDDQP